VKRLEDIPKLHDEIDRLETDVARLTEENERLRALIVDAGYIIGSLSRMLPETGSPTRAPTNAGTAANGGRARRRNGATPRPRRSIVADEPEDQP
jgi:hypothetical protein